MRVYTEAIVNSISRYLDNFLPREEKRGKEIRLQGILARSGDFGLWNISHGRVRFEASVSRVKMTASSLNYDRTRVAGSFSL